MNIEEAIAILEREGGRRGRTASPGHRYYERGRHLDYVRCDCSYNDTEWGPGYDFIAPEPGKTYWVVGSNARGQISCGPYGYHHEKYTNTTPCVTA